MCGRFLRKGCKQTVWPHKTHKLECGNSLLKRADCLRRNNAVLFRLHVHHRDFDLTQSGANIDSLNFAHAANQYFWIDLRKRGVQLLPQLRISKTT